MFCSYTCNRRSHLWDYVKPREAFCYFLNRIVSRTGCFSIASIGHPFLLLCSPLFSFVLLCSPFSFLLLSHSLPLFSFLLSSFFLEGGNKYVLSCVIQHEAGGLSKKHNRADRPISYLDTLFKTGSESIEATLRRRQILFAGFVARMENTRLPKSVIFGELVGGAGCVGGQGKEWMG